MTKVFIDGSSGTTGLRIHERLASRNDIELIKIPEEHRKDNDYRADAMNSADIVFFCLPDQAAIEAAGLITNPDTAVIDTSTAHRVHDAWAFGFPEIGQREKILNSKRIANPGCHASGFLSIAAPLVQMGAVSKDVLLSCFSLTGYSGGGKKMIAQYEEEDRDPLLKAPRYYGITQSHKHLPEMVKYSGLVNKPVFCPIVGDFYSGMEVVVSLHTDDLKLSFTELNQLYADYYHGPIVKFNAEGDESGFASAGKFSGRDDMEISVFGNDERITVVSRFDNLGKGASGAAIQNMNLLMGAEETLGLVL